MNIFEPHRGRHVAPKRHGHETVPKPRVEPISGYRTPTWDIFADEPTWEDSDLFTQEDRKAAA